VQTVTQKLALVVKKEEKRPPVDREPPLIFVDVSAAQSHAGSAEERAVLLRQEFQSRNPDAEQDTAVPKITGAQTQVPKTEDAPRNKFDKLMPAPPTPRNEVAEEARAKPTLTPAI